MASVVSARISKLRAWPGALLKVILARKNLKINHYIRKSFSTHCKLGRFFIQFYREWYKNTSYPLLESGSENGSVGGSPEMGQLSWDADAY